LGVAATYMVGRLQAKASPFWNDIIYRTLSMKHILEILKFVSLLHHLNEMIVFFTSFYALNFAEIVLSGFV
jgi:hypothetical protein